MMKYLCDDMKLTERDEIAVMINGFGFTSPLELCILGRRVRSLLAEKNARVHDIFIDELFRPQGTGGLSISIMRLDDELKKYYDMPAYSPFFKKEAIGG
jgi:dihydroxyacetone kinase